jgi:hypothetical protein
VTCNPVDDCHAAGVCDPTTGQCSTGAELACAAPAPRPLTPLSGQTLSIARPTFRWRLEPGSDGAAIDLCRDRACTMIEQTLVATGSSLALDVDLSAGTWYWRLRGRLGTAEGMRNSPTWAFTVGACVAGNVTAKTQIADVNGDGWGDLLKSAPSVYDPTINQYVRVLEVYLGSASGTSVNPDKTIYLRQYSPAAHGYIKSITAIGDWNGDGFSDVLVHRTGETYIGTLVRLLGDGVSVLTMDTEWTTGTCYYDSIPVCDERWGEKSAGGDFNSDGSSEYAYNDTYGSDGYYAWAGEVHLSTNSLWQPLKRPTAAGENYPYDGFGKRIEIIDHNCDGYDDLIVDAATPAKRYIYLGSSTGLSSTPSVTL